MIDKFNQNNSDDCTRCGKTVYAAEKFLDILYYEKKK